VQTVRTVNLHYSMCTYCNLQQVESQTIHTIVIQNVESRNLKSKATDQPRVISKLVSTITK